MDFARHEAELNAPGTDGVTLRSVYEEKARKGEPLPVEFANPPELPDGVGHLYGYALELLGRSGAGMSGFAPLTFTTIRDWSALTGWTLAPRDVDALLRLDSVMRNAGQRDESPVAPADKPVEIAPWPKKRVTDDN